MTLSQGYHCKRDSRVYELLKSLNGLKHVPRKWNEKLCSSLFSFNFQQSISYYSLFVRNQHHSIVILLVYVDDIILTGNNNDEIDKVKNFLKLQISIKDLGNLKYFLVLELLTLIIVFV